MRYKLSVQRRTFLARSGTIALGTWLSERILTGNATVKGQPVTVKVDVGRQLGPIPPDFLGLGYEISSAAVAGLLSAGNRTYVQLLRTLSPQGVIRVGGNTSDDSSFSPAKKAVSAPKGTVVTTDALQQLGTFLDATNWRLIWGLNLGSTDERQALAEAKAVALAAKSKLLAFEIGNEPDLFGRGTGHRPKSYRYEDYLQEYRRYKAAIRAQLPAAPFAGPDVASATAWVAQFAKDEGSDLKLLTHHYYRECASATSTMDKLLRADPKLAPALVALQGASSLSKVPYRICEVNSFCGGGKPGVSDRFGAALWVLGYMFQLAYAGCAGVNMETGLNQLGFVSSYSPIGQNENGSFFAAPEYYGMLAFAYGSQGTLVVPDYQTNGANFAVYAVVNKGRGLSVTIVNKESSLDIDASIVVPNNFPIQGARVLRLSASALQAGSNVTFGDAGVSPAGTWRPASAEAVDFRAGRGTLRVPAASAAVLKCTV
jgi:hypothetical protein